MDDSQDQAAPQQEIDVNPMMHMVAPVAAIVVTMLVRKALNSGYEKATGRVAPLPRDPRIPFMRALGWTVAITTTAAVAELVVYRLINQMGEKKSIEA